MGSMKVRLQSTVPSGSATKSGSSSATVMVVDTKVVLVDAEVEVVDAEVVVMDAEVVVVDKWAATSIRLSDVFIFFIGGLKEKLEGTKERSSSMSKEKKRFFKF
jgi:hypothetical protein